MPNLIKNDELFFWIAVGVYILAAWSGIGFYHSDEHYTIIEYASYKMGAVSAPELTCEFDVRIKPALLPFMAFIFIKVFGFLGIQDPYTQTFVLRFLTTVYALFSIRWFVQRSMHMVLPGFRTTYLFLSYFLWFLPLLNVRFLSESLSGILLLNTLSILLNPNVRERDYLIAGGLIGLGFLVRFPHALLGLGIFLWLVFIRGGRLRFLVGMAVSAGFLVFLGTLLDRWLYGEFVLSWWNYFLANIVGDAAAEFGTEAWWNYFYSIFRFSFFPIGIPIIISFLLLTIKQPGSIFIWTILPFFIIHSIIPHKELRYLFPFANLVPLMLILAYQEIHPAIQQWKKPARLVIRYIFYLLVIINCMGVVTVSLKSSDGGLMTITRFIRQNYGEQSIRLISFGESNPYGPRGTMATFYVEKDMEDIRLESLKDLNDSILAEDRVNLLVLLREDAASDEVREFILTRNVTKEVQCVPEWMEPILSLYGGFRMRDIRELYEIHP